MTEDEPKATPTTSPDADNLTIAIAGDVHFTERTAKLLTDPDTAFGPMAKVFRDADHAVVNLETAVTTGGRPEPKQFHFRAPASAFDAVSAAGVDLVSLANNHVLDYGQTGLDDTLRYAADAGVAVVGAGEDVDDALAPYYVDIGGTTIAYVAASGVWELTDSWMAEADRPGVAHLAHGERLERAVEDAADRADVVIVLPHWGTEGQECPNDEQRDWAERFAAAGADAVIGAHAHLLQGQGYLDDTFVAYGLGNFVWWWDDAYSNDTGVVELTITDGRLTDANFVPAVIDGTGRPIPATGEEERRVREELRRATDCSGLAERPE
ncbi:CapA family protein [Stackebrandtia soli]|uniref:CapA family protein n=1 Tax=Stackebrandtia soli TaxID=1892856 RepID=UPI0039ECDD12